MRWSWYPSQLHLIPGGVVAVTKKTASVIRATPSFVYRTVARTGNAGILTTAGVAGGVAVPVASTAALGAAGFTTAGVTAGSVAAGIQSGMGGYIAAGSWFATAQSTGALGGFAILGPVGIVAGYATALGTYYYLRDKGETSPQSNV